MKIVAAVLWATFLSFTAAQEREDLVASAGEDLLSAPAGVAPYNEITSTCSHPVLLSAASFASNFFCENVLKVAVEDLDCQGLFYQVLEAEAQIVDGANFRQTVVVLDETSDCVIAFKSKIYMPMPHTGTEPEVDMDELVAVGCDDDSISFEATCPKSLSFIDAYWKDDIENGGGAGPITSLAQEEKVEEEEEAMIEAVQQEVGEPRDAILSEPLEEEGNVDEVPSLSDSSDSEELEKGGDVEEKEEEVYGGGTKKTTEEVYGETQQVASVPASGTPDTLEQVVPPVPMAAPEEQATEEVYEGQTQKVASVPASTTPSTLEEVATPVALAAHDEEVAPAAPITAVNEAPLDGTSTYATSTQGAASPLGESVVVPAPLAAPLDTLNAASLPSTNMDVTSLQEVSSPNSDPMQAMSVPTDPTAAVSAALSTVLSNVNTNATGTQAEAMEAKEEVLEEVEAELVEEISAFAEEVQAQAEIQQHQMAAYEMEEEQYEDESTWAFAGKTDECSRFGVSPAEGIAFKCDKTVYICGETMAFREKFLLLLQDPVVDYCDLGDVKEIYSSRGDCNFFPKNEHYLQRDGNQRQGHNLYCPNGATLDSYYMFCTQELDNYYCDGENCDTCEVTGRRRNFLRH